MTESVVNKDTIRSMQDCQGQKCRKRDRRGQCTIPRNCDRSQLWTVKILLNNEEFCIDTGAEVIAISERTHHLIDSLELQPLH